MALLLSPAGGHGLALARRARPRDFAGRHWGRRPLLTRAADRPARPDLFGPDAVDELLARRALRTPFLRMAKDGRTLDPSTFTLGGGVGARSATRSARTACCACSPTARPSSCRRCTAPGLRVADAAQDLAADLGHPVQVNAYVTPPQNRGFDDHYDVHDVFVVQVAGEKHWQVRPPVSSRRCATSRGPTAGMPCGWPPRVRPPSTRFWAPATASTFLGGGCTRRPRSGARASTSRWACTSGPAASSPTTCSGRPGEGSTPTRRCAPRSPSASTRSTRGRRGLSPGVRAAVAAALEQVTDDELADALARRAPGGAAGRADRGAAPARGIRRPGRRSGGRVVTSPRGGSRAGDGSRTLVTRVARVDVPDRPPSRGSRDVLAGVADCRRPRPRCAGSLRPAQGCWCRRLGPSLTGRPASGRGAHHEPGRQHGLGRAPSRPAIRASSRSAITAPISSTGWFTEVSAGSVCRQTGESSNPTSATSSGTRSPASRSTRRAPTAIRSEAANTASGTLRRPAPHASRLPAGLAVVTEGHAQVLRSSPPRRGRRAPRRAGHGPRTCPADRRARRADAGRARAGGRRPPPHRAGCRRRRRRRVGPDADAAAHGRHAARLEAGDEVVVGVQRQQQHPVDVLLGEVGRDVLPVTVGAGHREQQLERRGVQPLADPAHDRREVRLAEDAGPRARRRRGRRCRCAG